MRQIDLQEHQASESCQLTAEQAGALDSLKVKDDEGGKVLEVTPSMKADGCYTLKPGAIVGALEIDGLSVLIRPKIGVPQLLSLACYAMGLFRSRERQLFDFKETEALPDTLALALAAAAERAFARGLLHGYRAEEETLYTVRGRIRFDDQLRRRFSVPLPVEVGYDEFTDDIPANRLVKAAAYRLGAMELRSADARRRLGRVAGVLETVALAEFPANDVPEVRFDRLNEHYRDVVGLARLILRHSAFESDRGAVRANGFLIDMNKLFQEFVLQALREKLGVSDKVFGEGAIDSLDYGDKVRLRPDLTWWDGGKCRFVGDVKYKNLVRRENEPPNADIYQLLAYATALDLPGGMLIYAKGEAEPEKYRVRHAGKTLEVAAVDLELPLGDVLQQVGQLAERVRAGVETWMDRIFIHQ